jgi:hypothetical protein
LGKRCIRVGLPLTLFLPTSAFRGLLPGPGSNLDYTCFGSV